MVDVKLRSLAKAGVAGMLLAAGAVATAGLTAGEARTPAADPLVVRTQGAPFAKAGRDEPVMRIAGIGPGGTRSGSVTIANTGTLWRYASLTGEPPADRIGEGGGSLSPVLSLTVLDVTDSRRLAVVYRGPATGLGVRPLGFVPPGASRTYSVTATVPRDLGLPATAGNNPFAGSSTGLPLHVNSLEGGPAARSAFAPAAPRRPRAPRLRVDVDRTHHPLETGSLRFGVRCRPRCGTAASGRIAIGSSHWTVPASGPAATAGTHGYSLAIPAAARPVMRAALLGSTPVRITLVVRASGRGGTHSRAVHPIVLDPRD